MDYKHAIVKFNGGRGALLCNGCRVVLKDGFDHVDRIHTCCLCSKTEEECPDCGKPLMAKMAGGVACSVCSYWFCY